MNTTKKELLWICPNHPKAQIKHVWDVLNNYPAGEGKYECAECGLELDSIGRDSIDFLFDFLFDF